MCVVCLVAATFVCVLWLLCVYCKLICTAYCGIFWYCDFSSNSLYYAYIMYVCVYLPSADIIRMLLCG